MNDYEYNEMKINEGSGNYDENFLELNEYETKKHKEQINYFYFSFLLFAILETFFIGFIVINDLTQKNSNKPTYYLFETTDKYQSLSDFIKKDGLEIVGYSLESKPYNAEMVYSEENYENKVENIIKLNRKNYFIGYINYKSLENSDYCISYVYKEKSVEKYYNESFENYNGELYIEAPTIGTSVSSFPCP